MRVTKRRAGVTFKVDGAKPAAEPLPEVRMREAAKQLDSNYPGIARFVHIARGVSDRSEQPYRSIHAQKSIV